MPRITIHAIPLEVVLKASRPMVDELVTLLGVPREYLSFEVRNDPFVRDGELVSGDPFVEVALFDRGQDVEDQAARIITRQLQAAGCPHLDLYLRQLERRRYFEDGTPF